MLGPRGVPANRTRGEGPPPSAMTRTVKDAASGQTPAKGSSGNARRNRPPPKAPALRKTWKTPRNRPGGADSAAAACVLGGRSVWPSVPHARTPFSWLAHLLTMNLNAGLRSRQGVSRAMQPPTAARPHILSGSPRCVSIVSLPSVEAVFSQPRVRRVRVFPRRRT